MRRVMKAAGAALLSLTVGCSAAAPKMAESRPYRGGEVATEAEPGSGFFGGIGSDDGAPALDPAPQAPPPPPMQAPAPAATATAPGSQAAPPSTETARAPMLVYTATMRLAVFQVAEASKQVEAMARETGGFLARRDDTSIVIRVPAARFEDVLARIEKLGDVIHRNVSAEDVTEQFLDVEVRLKNARAVRARLQQLLEKATRVEDSLAIERELARIGVQIETLEGKLKYLRDRVAFSTITVSFQAKRTDAVKPSVRMPVYWLDQLGLGRLLSL